MYFKKALELSIESYLHSVNHGITCIQQLRVISNEFKDVSIFGCIPVVPISVGCGEIDIYTERPNGYLHCYCTIQTLVLAWMEEPALNDRYRYLH